MYINYDHISSIKGIGIDMTDIRRFQKMMPSVKEQLANKILTPDEYILYTNTLDKDKILAQYFCAKESISKALGTGFRGMWFTDIEIRKNDLGKPVVFLSPKADKIAQNLNIAGIQISFTHEIPYVMCYSVAY